MKHWRFLSLVFTLGFSCLVLAAETRSDIERTFKVTPGGTLKLEADFGSVEVATTGTDKVLVKVLRSTRAKEKEAQELFDNHQVSFEQVGQEVRVVAEVKDKRSFWNRRREHLEVQFQVEIPREFNVNLRTAAGSVRLGDLNGNARLNSAGGSLTAGEVTGTLGAETAAGSIKVGNAGGVTRIKSAGGSLSVDRAQASLDASTASGSIRVGTAKGELVLDSAGGSLTVGEASSKLKARTASGSIRVQTAAAEADLRTQGGTIEVGSARDTVTASTGAGSVEVGFAAAPSGDCSLSSLGGSITARIAEGVGFEVEASTLGGRIQTEIPVQVVKVGEIGRSELKGKLGNGGQRLRLKTNAGNISIQKL